MEIQWERLHLSRLLDLIHLNSAEKADRGLSHTPGEILQQPETWATTFLHFQQRRAEIEAFLETAGIRPNSGDHPIVFLIGAGTSDYIGHAIASLLQQKWQCEVAAIASTDLLTNFEDYVLRNRKYLWISFSRSGDSPEGVAVLEKALDDYPEIFHLVISCNANGKMIQTHRDDRRVFALLLDDAVNDRGLAMTSSFSNMIISGQWLANLWTVSEYETILHSLIAGAEKLLGAAPDIAAQIAEGPFTNVCFTGSGSLKAVARESALKVSELTAGRIRTMSESILGLRHGPLAALNEETLFVCFISGDHRRQRYEIDLLQEIGEKEVVPARVAVSLQPSEKLKAVSEYLIVPGARLLIPDAYRPPLDVIVGQLLGLFFSLRCNLKPDAPSPKGVISRVVQNVNIH